MKHKELTQKKERLDRHRPFPAELKNSLDNWFRVELTYTSNAIEGNTLTRQETALVLEKGLAIGNKTLSELLEARNHAAAFDWVNAQVMRPLTEQDILSIHSLILKGIDDDNTGRYRSIPVRISGSPVVLPNPIKVPILMDEFIQWITTSSHLHPIEFAALAHYKLVTIHPFIDGNGRTARLLMNLILMLKGYPPAIIRKRDRIPYLKSLEKAQLGGSLDDYHVLISKAVDRSFDIYFETIEGKSTRPIKESFLKIGALAKEVKEAPSTIRHWTKKGLLEVTEHTESGYSLYLKSSIETVRRIQKLKGERYSLSEIKSKLS